MYYSLRSCVAQVRRDFPFDVILAVWAYPDAFAAAKLAREYNCPLVINVLGSDVNELTKNPRLCRQIVQSMQTAYCTIAVSVALRDRLLDLGIPPNRTVVQHNGVDGERFTLCDRRTARAQLGLPLDVPTICYIGRLGQEKGVDILLRAMHDLKTSGRGDIELNLVGWGECEAALRLQVSRMQLENQVHFRGPRPHHEVPQWISAGDLLCLPSRREGCPNVILEALASGRPVVAARVGGVPELIDAHNGVLVPPEDPTALAAGLVYALQRAWNPEELRATVEFLSWDAVGERYYARLVEALKAQPSPGSSAVRDTDKRA
jgi:glycosyltransferase involved in cell wall biosynthesis